MAAVMMRAMGLGSESSKSSSQPVVDGTNEDGLSLSRTTSRLQPPYVAGNPHGILINPLRPISAPNSPPAAAAPIYSNPSAGSSAASINLPRILSGSDIANRSSYASSLASVPSSPTDERGRPISLDSDTRATSHGRPAMPTTILADTGLTKIESLENRKIRFAPLPEIHGRDGEWDVAGIEDLTADELTRTQSAGLTYERHHMNDEEDDDDDDEDEREPSKMGSMFGSWKSDNSFGGRRSADDDDRSRTAKLLRPLSFGLVGGKKKSRSGSKGRSSTSADSLSRVSSNESDISRGSSMEGGYKSTGIPMRKTRTWESNDSGGAPREVRRAQYPPVAQRSRTARKPMSISAPEPAFNEWGTSGSVGSVAASSRSQNDDEDDGGGMAWIKKRRAQREADKKAAEEEAARKAKEEEEAAARGEDAGAEGGDDVPFAIDDEDQNGDTVMELSTSTPQGAHTPALTVTDRRASVNGPSSSSSTPATSTTPKTQHSLLGMTRPSLNITTASADSSPALHGGKNFDHNPPIASPMPMDSPMSIGTPPRDIHQSDSDDQAHAQRLSDKLGKLAIGGRSTSYKGPASPTDMDDESDEEDSDSDDDDEDNSDNDSDLDEEELRQEEALVEQARITAKSAGAERFHTAKHQSSVVEVEGRVDGRRPGVATRQSTITGQPSRQNTLVAPSRQSTLVPPSRQPTL